MNNIAINLDEVINGLSKTHLATLQQAAEISPFIKCRTIGPDLEPWDERTAVKPDISLNKENAEKENQSQTANNVTEDKTKIPENKKVVTQRRSDSFIPIAMPLNIIDEKTLNASIQLRQAEKQIKMSIRQELIDKQQRHLEETKKTSEKELHQYTEERNKRLDMIESKQKKLLEEAERQTAKELEQQKRELEDLQKQTQRQLQMIAFQGISKYQNKFRTQYESIAKLLISIDKESILACGDYNRRLKESIQMFEDLIAQMKKGNFGAAELKVAESLCNSLDELETNILNELQNIVKQEEERVAEQKVADDTKKLQEQIELQQQQQQQQQQKQQQEQQQQQQQNEANAAAMMAAAGNKEQTIEHTTQSTTPPNEQHTTDGPAMAQVSAERQKFYYDIMGCYHQKVENVKAFQADENLKKYRNTCQRTVNTPINAISNVSGEFLLDKYNKLCSFFAGQPQATNFGHVTINDHPAARDYCLLLMAKTFVGKAYLEISSKNSQIAFAIATVIVALWKAIPEFGQIYLAHTFKQSPLLAPIYLPKKPEQSDEEYLTVLGYHHDKSGKLEEQEVYLKRQAGIARLYACVMITQGRQVDGPTHPYGLEQAWYWLVNFVMIEPMPSISANVLLEILEIIGAEMWLTYSKQFIKLLVYIQFNYMPRLNAIDQGGPKVRLEMLLDKYLKEGQIAKPNGMLPAGFW